MNEPLIRRYGGTFTEWLLELVPYLEKEMLALRAMVPRGGTCLDVGAAGGTYTYLLARLVGPDGRVHAFEPRPRSYHFLERARRLLRLHQATLHPLALTERAGTHTLVVPRRGRIPFTTRSFLKRGLTDLAGAYPEFGSAREVTVETTTLDDFARHLQRLDFLKLDVEGAEPWVLEGGERTIASHRPLILCEVEARHLAKYGRTPSDLVDWMTGRGYRPFRFHRGRLHPVGAITPAENNYFFAP